MTEDEITKLALDGLGKILNQLPTKSEKSDALGVLMITGYNLLRALEGDEFVHGWLDSALADIEVNPPVCEWKLLN